jgi:hypothetical protein
MSYSGGQQSFRNGRILMFGFKLGEFLKTFIRMNNTSSGICFDMFPLLLSQWWRSCALHGWLCSVATLLMTTRLLLVMIRLMRFLSSFDMEELSYDVYSKSGFTLILNGQHVS